MFDVLTIIIIIFVAIGKLINKDKQTPNTKGRNLWDDFEKSFKKLNDPIGTLREESRKLAKTQPTIRRTEIGEAVMKSIKIEEEKDEIQTKSYSVDNAAETKVTRKDAVKAADPKIYEDASDEESDYEYELSINREDLIKSIIFSELINEPLCKRNAK